MSEKAKKHQNLLGIKTMRNEIIKRRRMMIKRNHVFNVILLVFLLSGFQTIVGTDKAGDFPVLKGPYLGQKTPGMVPEMFAPGIISTKELHELNAVFSPKGDEFFYTIHYKPPDERYVIMHTKQVNGVWTKPKRASFSTGSNFDVDMAFSTDGKKLYFCSNRPRTHSTENNPVGVNMDIWYVHCLENGWTRSLDLGAPVNSPADESYPTFPKSGVIYFASARQGGKGDKDVYRAEFGNGKFSEPVNLGDAINTEYGEGDSYVAPDESYIIVNSWGRPQEKGLYISFKKKDGTWTPGVNMKKLPPHITGGCPMVSPDGKYLFFTRKGDIYWVNVKIIDKFRPKNLE